LGRITRLRGITRLADFFLVVLGVSPGMFGCLACFVGFAVVEIATGKGLSVAVIKVSCSVRPFSVTEMRIASRSKLRTLMPLSEPFSAIQ
jgi:hypothetical protein